MDFLFSPFPWLIGGDTCSVEPKAGGQTRLLVWALCSHTLTTIIPMQQNGTSVTTAAYETRSVQDNLCYYIPDKANGGTF